MFQSLFSPVTIICFQSPNDLNNWILWKNFQNFVNLESWKSDIVKITLFNEPVFLQPIECLLVSHFEIVVDLSARFFAEWVIRILNIFKIHLSDFVLAQC